MRISRRTLLGSALASTAAAAASRGQARAAYRPDPAPMPVTLPRMIRGYADGPYGQVHYQDGGGSGPPVLLIHQAPMSSRQFESVFGHFLERGLRPIAIDCPGFGQSDVTTFVPRIEDWATVVPPVLDHLGIQTVDVVGHHTGALVATEVEQQFPERVRRLVLAGPVPLEDEERAAFLDGVQLREIDFEYQDDGSHLLNAFASRHRMYLAGGSAPDPRLITRYTVERFVGYGPFWYGHHAAFIYDHNATLMKIRKPTLILTNTGDQIYEHARWASRMRPDFAYVELQGGGVDIVDQLPAEWVAAIASFLAA